MLTDALIGTFASAHDPSLRQNRCFLYHMIGNDGEWKVPVGGMGTVTAELVRVAQEAKVSIKTGCPVNAIKPLPDGGGIVCLADGESISADDLGELRTSNAAAASRKAVPSAGQQSDQDQHRDAAAPSFPFGIEPSCRLRRHLHLGQGYASCMPRTRTRLPVRSRILCRARSIAIP